MAKSPKGGNDEYERLACHYGVYEKGDRVSLPAPLFCDQIYDAPTDPTIIWNREEKQWYLADI